MLNPSNHPLLSTPNKEENLLRTTENFTLEGPSEKNLSPLSNKRRQMHSY